MIGDFHEDIQGLDRTDCRITDVVEDMDRPEVFSFPQPETEHCDPRAILPTKLPSENAAAPYSIMLEAARVGKCAPSYLRLGGSVSLLLRIAKHTSRLVAEARSLML